MPSLHFTDLAVSRLKMPGTYYDDATPAFGLRVGKNRKTWFVIRGKGRLRTNIGRYPSVPLGDARKEAKALLCQPVTKQSRITFETAYDAFKVSIERLKPRTQHDYKRLVERHFLPQLGTKKLVDLSFEDVAHCTKAAPPGEANHALAVAHIFLRWCGRRALTKLFSSGAICLSDFPSPNETSDPIEKEALAMIDDMLLSPVLKRVLCRKPNFAFAGSTIAKINRADLGDYDAFLLACMLVGQFRGQVIVPDFGFYGREFHTSLIRQNRLIAGLNSLSEVSSPLQQALMGIKDKTVYRTTREDAERLMFYIDPAGNPSRLVEQEGSNYLSTA